MLFFIQNLHVERENKEKRRFAELSLLRTSENNKKLEIELLQKQIEYQKAIQQERERISHDMHDDLGAGISAIKLHAEFLKNKVNDDNINEDINDILKTSEEMNLSMREILWSLNSGNDTVGDLVEYSAIYAESFFRKFPIEINFNKINIKSEQPISTEKRRNLFLCFKESLNNIYKHSEAKNIVINYIQDKNFLQVEMMDDGIGLPKKMDRKGNGLKNMKRRMDAVDGEFLIKNEAKGTKIVFSVDL